MVLAATAAAGQRLTFTGVQFRYRGNAPSRDRVRPRAQQSRTVVRCCMPEAQPSRPPQLDDRLRVAQQERVAEGMNCLLRLPLASVPKWVVHGPRVLRPDIAASARQAGSKVVVADHMQPCLRPTHSAQRPRREVAELSHLVARADATGRLPSAGGVIGVRTNERNWIASGPVMTPRRGDRSQVSGPRWL